MTISVHQLATSQPRLAELDGQPVEQFRVARLLALRAEVLGRLHEPGAEEHLPVAIDRHARRQRMRPVDISHFARPSRFAGCGLRAAAAATPACRPSPSRPSCRTAPRMSTNVSRGFGHLLHHHRVGIAFSSSRQPLAQLADLLVELPHLGRDVVAVVRPQFGLLGIGALRRLNLQDRLDDLGGNPAALVRCRPSRSPTRGTGRTGGRRRSS